MASVAVKSKASRESEGRVRPNEGRDFPLQKLGGCVFEYIEDIQEMCDPAKIADALSERLARLGVGYFVIANLARSTAEFKRGIIAARMHAGWTKRFYEQGDAEDNPVLSGVALNPEPVFWSELAAKPGVSRRLTRMHRDARDFGLNEGLCVPIFSPGRLAASAVFFGFAIDKTPATRVAIHAMALYTHHRLVRLADSRKDKKLALTGREADCLAWVAQGKTDWEIGEILQIRENTVHWYVENAKRKLGVATRIQAVVAAIQEGGIRI